MKQQLYTWLRWQPLSHPPRRLMVACIGCGRAEVNESNRLHRTGWEETATTPRAYRCGLCASPPEAA